ncbi:hypothetical protein [Spiroplasma endosymbiont of Danaus chrysippus]|uniref:hypothetical protein n=1 Tax=Spiroplasma endosymbiont of Danaus chrysippus TaxID=2691041 RepID=UPI00157A25DE|nr:hypothetical protein [Spiroplasma endosymbiont of Danaus chrysippus]
MTKKEKQLHKKIKEFNEVIEKCNQNILNFKKQKYGKFKNIFLKIISFGFYDWNGKIENEIKHNKSTIEEIKEKILQTNKMLLKFNNQKTAMVKKQNIKNEISESKNINISSKLELSLQQEENK